MRALPARADHEADPGVEAISHRQRRIVGKLRKLGDSLDDPNFVAQLIALRLAVILCHARRDPDLQGLLLERPESRFFAISCRLGWSELYPQSAYLLREEVVAWQKTGWRIELTIA